MVKLLKPSTLYLVWIRPWARVLLLTALIAGLGFPAVASGQRLGLTELTIADINRAFDAGTISSETLVERYLARIAAYDQAELRLNAVLWLNTKAVATARALDRERRKKGPRSPLHGIPVVLKDNIDTSDMPTTGGSVLLAGSIPPDDAFIVRKLRESGAIILAKLNMSELASGAAVSSQGGPMRNPHDLRRSPSGSSGGTGIAIAVGYAQAGLGTDTGGSVRGPSTVNGIVGLKTTHGLLSRDGIIPLSLSLDTAGPMARHVYDIAAMLNVMTGIDPADPSTQKSKGRVVKDYTAALDPNALRGARIGIARDFLGQDQEVDWIIEASLEAMRKAGATIVDVRLPQWIIDITHDLYTALRMREFRVQIHDYFATLKPGYPKTLDELIAKSLEFTSPKSDGGQPNPPRWAVMQREVKSGSLTDPEYVAVRNHGLPLLRDIIEGIMSSENLDAIVYPTRPKRPSLTVSIIRGPTGAAGGGGGPSPSNIANLTGFPDLTVPAGFTSNRLPVGISFLGAAFSESRLIALGYAFEQATKARRDPIHTPALPGKGN